MKNLKFLTIFSLISISIFTELNVIDVDKFDPSKVSKAPKILSDTFIEHLEKYNISQDSLNSLLPLAILFNSENLVQYLIKKGVDLNQISDDGVPLLTMAVENNRPKIVSILLQAGANPNIQDPSGNTPLHEAVNKNNHEIIKMLLNAGANKNLTMTLFISGFTLTPLQLAELYRNTHVDIDPQIIELLKEPSTSSFSLLDY